MKNPVAIRDLKANLSRHLRTVKRGKVVRISERGRVIAEIKPVQLSSEQEGLLKLRETGLISWNGSKPKGASHPLPSGKKPASEYVAEGRR